MSLLRVKELEAQLARREEYIMALEDERLHLVDHLRLIAEFAHDKSTGPTIVDDLWIIREMAYEAL